jgi:hypothetical protein
MNPLVSRNPIETWRNFNAARWLMFKLMGWDSAKHHQPIYLILGLGHSKIGQLVFWRLSSIMFFPGWLLGVALLETMGLLKRASFRAVSRFASKGVDSE